MRVVPKKNIKEDLGVIFRVWKANSKIYQKPGMREEEKGRRDRIAVFFLSLEHTTKWVVLLMFGSRYGLRDTNNLLVSPFL